MAQYVQYIVIRKDLVEQMGYGKTAAQVAHASLGAVVEKGFDEVEGFYGRQTYETTRLCRDPAIKGWFNGSFAKLVVYVKTKQKLLNLCEKLDKDGIRIKLIYDACNTILEPEENNGTTLTCTGIIPLHRDNVPKYLKKLRLLE